MFLISRDSALFVVGLVLVCGLAICGFLHFCKNIKNHENKTIINCSSNEYFNVIDQKNLNGNILNTVFKEYRDGELKFISFNAKKARGLLAKFIINNKITNNNDLKDFNLENYKFDSLLSDDSTFVFTRG